MSAESGNQGLERFAAVLEAIAMDGPSRVSDVVQVTGLKQATVSRLLASLERVDYVQRDPNTGEYRAGLALLSLAGAALNEQAVYRQARQPAQDLAASLGLGVNLAVRRESELYYLSNFEGSLAPKNFTLMGHRNPLHATAIGKCLMAEMDGMQRRTLLPELRSFTVHTLVEHEALDEAVSLISRKGYATEKEELALGRTCLAAPIRDGSGRIVAAISVSGPLTALDLDKREEEVGTLTIQAADAISTALGHFGPSGTLHPAAFPVGI